MSTEVGQLGPPQRNLFDHKDIESMHAHQLLDVQEEPKNSLIAFCCSATALSFRTKHRDIAKMMKPAAIYTGTPGPG